MIQTSVCKTGFPTDPAFATACSPINNEHRRPGLRHAESLLNDNAARGVLLNQRRRQCRATTAPTLNRGQIVIGKVVVLHQDEINRRNEQDVCHTPRFNLGEQRVRIKRPHDDDGTTCVPCWTSVQTQTTTVKRGRHIEINGLAGDVNRLPHADGVVEEVAVCDLCPFGRPVVPDVYQNGPCVVIGQAR